VEDTTPPVLHDTVSDETNECSQISDPASVYATDNSGDATSTLFSETREDGSCPFTYTLTRVWDATDACGNVNTDTQVVEIEDTTAPVLVGYNNGALPADVTVECDSVPVAYDGEVEATDNCDSVATVSMEETRKDGSCDDAYTLTRVWTSTDDCGNTNTHTQVISVSDNTDPTWESVDEQLSVEYPDIPVMVEASLTPADNCASASDIDTDFDETRVDGDSTCEYSLVRTWTATDNCGNSHPTTQTVTVSDVTPPELSRKPEDISVECDEVPEPCANEAVDVCDGEVAVSVNSNIIWGSEASGTYKMTNTYTATDEAGNSASHVQTVTVSDSAGPIFSRYPSDLSVACDCDTFPEATTLLAIDNCDESVSVSFVEVRVDGNSLDDYTLIRTWSAEDEAGNTVTHQQQIVVTDEAAPVLYDTADAADEDVDCALVAPAAVLFAADGCDSTATVTLQETREDGACDQSYTVFRKYTSTDRSGNTATHSQTVGVTDTTAPAYDEGDLACLWPADDTYAVYPYATTTLLEASDDCGSPSVTFTACNSTQTTAVSSFDDDCHYSASADTLYVRASRDSGNAAGRTYTLYAHVSDECGNTAAVTKDFWVPSEARDYALLGLTCKAGSISDLP